jgi:hypothetical protein
LDEKKKKQFLSHPKLNIGLSDGKIVPDSAVGKYANSYALINDDEEWGYYW